MNCETAQLDIKCAKVENKQADPLNPISMQRGDLTDLTSPRKIACVKSLIFLEIFPLTKYRQRIS